VKDLPEDPRPELPPAEASSGHTGARESSEEAEVTSTICSECANALAAYRKPVLVVSREWVRMYEELVEMFKNRPEIQVILDRRQPTGGEGEPNGWSGPERRRSRHPLALE
jgi:hypothetical protein